jgi:hypothetical protein
MQRPRRFDASVTCNLCKQQTGKHSVSYHLANEFPKKPVLGWPQVKKGQDPWWEDGRTGGWWRGGE